MSKRSRRFARSGLAAALLLGHGAAHADSPGAQLAHQGQTGTPACASCHGAHGEGLAAGGFPRLAGQNQTYLAKQLQDFARGARVSATMKPIAASLNAQQMQAVAAYYASLPGWHPGAVPAANAAYKTGYLLASRGNWNDGLPACFACHGNLGAGIAPHFPALAGQPAAYTRAQMDAWQRGQRRNDPQGLMQAVARKMSEAEIAAVSAYFEHPSPVGALP
jgi:cytochrome c553